MDSALVARHNLHVHFPGVCSLEEVKALSSHTLSSTDSCQQTHRHLGCTIFGTECSVMKQPDSDLAGTTGCHTQEIDSTLFALVYCREFTGKTEVRPTFNWTYLYSHLQWLLYLVCACRHLLHVARPTSEWCVAIAHVGKTENTWASCVSTTWPRHTDRFTNRGEITVHDEFDSGVKHVKAEALRPCPHIMHNGRGPSFDGFVVLRSLDKRLGNTCAYVKQNASI